MNKYVRTRNEREIGLREGREGRGEIGERVERGSGFLSHSTT